MKIRVIDTETTGIDASVDKVVELAFVELPASQGDHHLFYEALVNPEIPIPPTASAVHHIVDADVEDSPTLNELLDEISNCYGDADAFVAHNAQFDQSFLPRYHDKPWICTYRLARHLWPDASGYSNQALRYWLGLNVGLPKDSPMHRALPDAVVTAYLFKRERSELKQRGIMFNSPDEMAAFADAPVLLQTVPFGKHKDTKWSDLPISYLHWMDKQNDWDIDIKHTLATELNQRRQSNGNR